MPPTMPQEPAPPATAPPPGWYQEPFEPQGRLRWWDGARWTDHRRQAPVPASHLRAGTFMPSKPWHWLALAGAAVVGVAYLALVIAGAVLGGGS